MIDEAIAGGNSINLFNFYGESADEASSHIQDRVTVESRTNFESAVGPEDAGVSSSSGLTNRNSVDVDNDIQEEWR